jgi:hypothetical protein
MPEKEKEKNMKQAKGFELPSTRICASFIVITPSMRVHDCKINGGDH